MAGEMSGIEQVLRMLVAAYPHASISADTVKVYALMLGDVDEALLKAAAVAHIGGCKYFPTVAELRQAMDAEVRQRDQVLLAESHNQRALLAAGSGLQKRRQSLLEAAYAGDLDVAEWMSLIADYEAVGKEFGAVALRHKLEVLRGADVFDSERPETAVANGGYAIDTHTTSGSGGGVASMPNPSGANHPMRMLAEGVAYG